jgi:hypothetical protein
LLSYVWPEPPERFTRLRDAIGIAKANPVSVEKAQGADWLPGRLAEPITGTVHVVFHSVVWQYLDDRNRAEVRAALIEAGPVASLGTPLAWLRLEPHPISYAPAQLLLTLWDGRTKEPRDRLLATCGFHGGTMAWDYKG